MKSGVQSIFQDSLSFQQVLRQWMNETDPTSVSILTSKEKLLYPSYSLSFILTFKFLASKIPHRFLNIFLWNLF